MAVADDIDLPERPDDRPIDRSGALYMVICRDGDGAASVWVGSSRQAAADWKAEHAWLGDHWREMVLVKILRWEQR